MSERHLTNVYDFDGTIYPGDSSVDFIKYCLRRNVRLWKYVPVIIWELVLFVAGISTKERVKTVAFRFLSSVGDVDALVEVFWSEREYPIARWYLERQQESDVIISASPEFLLAPFMRRHGIRHLIATIIDKRTGELIGKNCHGEEKIRRLQEYDASVRIGDMYSDSLSDVPLMERATRAFMIKKGVIVQYDEYRSSWASELMTPTFLRFLFVGGLNASLGILLSYIWALMINNTLLAFLIGYSISLVISYFLNAVITFHEFRFSLWQFGRFIVSYIPNFCVLIISVYIFADLLHLYSLVSYILAAVIAAPVTFLLLSKFTFEGRRDG